MQVVVARCDNGCVDATRFVEIHICCLEPGVRECCEACTALSIADIDVGDPAVAYANLRQHDQTSN